MNVTYITCFLQSNPLLVSNGSALSRFMRFSNSQVSLVALHYLSLRVSEKVSRRLLVIVISYRLFLTCNLKCV